MLKSMHSSGSYILWFPETFTFLNGELEGTIGTYQSATICARYCSVGQIAATITVCSWCSWMGFRKSMNTLRTLLLMLCCWSCCRVSGRGSPVCTTEHHLRFYLLPLVDTLWCWSCVQSAGLWGSRSPQTPGITSSTTSGTSGIWMWCLVAWPGLFAICAALQLQPQTYY